MSDYTLLLPLLLAALSGGIVLCCAAYFLNKLLNILVKTLKDT